MSTSSFVVSAPGRSSARVEIRTGPIAERFLAALKEHAHRHSKSLPLRGGERAVQRKLDATDSLAMSIHETAAVLAHFSDEVAADLTQELLFDAGKGQRIAVSLLGNALPCAGDVRTVEREFAVLSGRFLSDLDEAITSHDPDRKRLSLEWQGMQARARMLMHLDREDS